MDSSQFCRLFGEDLGKIPGDLAAPGSTSRETEPRLELVRPYWCIGAGPFASQVLELTAPDEAWLGNNQNVNRVCISRRRLLAISENAPKPAPAGWFAWPKRGDVMLPMIGPGLLWFVMLRMYIDTVRPNRRLTGPITP